MPVGQVHRVCGPTENTKDQTGKRATHRRQVAATAATANGNIGEEGERLFTGKKGSTQTTSSGQCFCQAADVYIFVQ